MTHTPPEQKQHNAAMVALSHMLVRDALFITSDFLVLLKSAGHNDTLREQILDEIDAWVTKRAPSYLALPIQYPSQELPEAHALSIFEHMVAGVKWYYQVGHTNQLACQMYPTQNVDPLQPFQSMVAQLLTLMQPVSREPIQARTSRVMRDFYADPVIHDVYTSNHPNFVRLITRLLVHTTSQREAC